MPASPPNHPALANIRLSKEILTAIRESFAEHFLPTDHLWLFGSRTDPTKRGGDIDLYIQTDIAGANHAVRAKIAFLVALQRRIGEQKIDVILCTNHSPCHPSVEEVVQTTGVQLQ